MRLNVSPYRHMYLLCLNMSECVFLETHVSALSKCVSLCLLADTSVCLNVSECVSLQLHVSDLSECLSLETYVSDLSVLTFDFFQF